MLGSGFHLYLAHGPLTTLSTAAKTVDALIDSGGDAVGSGTVTVNTLNAATQLVGYDEIKNVTEGGQQNTINVTTRALGRTGVQGTEITSVNRDLEVEFVYEPRTSFAAPQAAYSILDLIEYLDANKSQYIFAIDLDGAEETASVITGPDGCKGAGANYQVAITQTREVEGQVVTTATFAVKSFYQRVCYDGGVDAEFKLLTGNP